MINDDIKNRLRERAKSVVRQWEATYLKPDPEAFICQYLTAANSRLDKDGLMTLDIAEQEVSGTLEWRAERILEDSTATPHFDRLLDELSLMTRPDLARIVERFSEHGVRVEIGRNFIETTFPNSAQFCWRACYANNEVNTIATSGTLRRPFAIGSFGTISHSSCHNLLWDVYGFFVVCCQRC